MADRGFVFPERVPDRNDVFVSIRNANVIATNDNWKDSRQNAIENTGLRPPNDLDAAILAMLAAGNYTAVVTGKNGSIGVALVEVYATH